MKYWWDKRTALEQILIDLLPAYCYLLWKIVYANPEYLLPKFIGLIRIALVA